MKTQTKPGEAAGKMERVAFGGVILSTAVAGIGVSGIVGWGSYLALAGTAVLIVGTLLTEIAAAQLPVQAERRLAEQRPLVAALAIAGFAALTAWNVMAGHMGMVAINRAALADQRAPHEMAALSASAARQTAEEALAAFDATSQRQEAALANALSGAFANGVVTASTRAAGASQAARETARAPLAQTLSAARAEEAQASARLANAPKGRPDHELWAFALILELLKGALVWFCTPRKRKEPAAGAIAPVDFDTLETEELDAMERNARSVAASCQQAKARRRKAEEAKATPTRARLRLVR